MDPNPCAATAKTGKLSSIQRCLGQPLSRVTVHTPPMKRLSFAGRQSETQRGSSALNHPAFVASVLGPQPFARLLIPTNEPNARAFDSKLRVPNSPFPTSPNVVFCRLSPPIFFKNQLLIPSVKMVGPTGFEPVTKRL